MSKKQKLTINMIPPKGWNKNVRTLRGTEVFDKIRRICYSKAGYCCEICGAVGEKHPVECHEEWSFDILTKNQTLVAFIALCPLCHKVKHWMRAAKTGEEFLIRKHIKKVNKWKYHRLEKYLIKYMKQFSNLYPIQWKIDISYTDQYLREDEEELEKISTWVQGLFNDTKA